jgi:hypothetical protein
MRARRWGVKADSRNPQHRGEARGEQEASASSAKERPSVVPVGARVRVLEGGLRGQVGVVTELDEKLGLRVQVGALAVWLREQDVLAVGSERDRPVLRSSHRKDPLRGPSDP